MNNPSEPQPLFPVKANAGALATVNESAAVARAAQEVQAAMVIAKRFPRDETAAFNRIMQACKRRSLAEVSAYAFPKGGQMIEGPSIRLAETLAQSWGNLDFGIIELDQHDGESSVMAYCWDLETNTRQTKIFTVKHQRKARGQISTLEDPREIYEMTANSGARRLRACILGIIPGDVAAAAVTECEKTMASGHKEPLIDRIRKMVTAFAGESVTQEMLEQRLGHKIDVTTEIELANLRKIFASLKDGMSNREQWFKPPTSKPGYADEGEGTDLGPEQQQLGQVVLSGAGAALKPEPEPEQATPPAYTPDEADPPPSQPNFLKGVQALLKSKKKTDADLLAYLRKADKVDPSLSSLEEIAMMSPACLQWVFENWMKETIWKHL